MQSRNEASAHLTTIQRAIGDVAGTVSRMRESYRSRAPRLSLPRMPPHVDGILNKPSCLAEVGAALFELTQARTRVTIAAETCI